MDARTRKADAASVPLRSTMKILLRQLREHNFSVLSASGATFVFAVAGWAILYGAAYWFTMFGLTVVHAGDAEMPAHFHTVCATIFGVLVLAATIDAWLFPHEHIVDERPTLATIGDLVLFLPRITVATLLNFTAWARLSQSALEDATALLERLRIERRIALATLPLDLPDDRHRDRILHVLQLLQLAEVRTEKGQLWLRLSPLAPAALRGRLIADHADDDLARMRRATVFEHKKALPGPKRQLPGYNRNDL